jgi:hypothetical protein
MSDPLRSDEPGGATTGIGAQALLGLLQGGANLSSLLMLLGQAPLTTEQRVLMELLQTLGSNGDDEEDQDAPVRTARPVADAAPDDAAEDAADDAVEPPPDAGGFRRLRQELDDLREVNDTVAAALGACRACWGGDADCPLCGGRGHAGAAPPDPRLFEALVVPAVRRRRARAHRSPTTEASL